MVWQWRGDATSFGQGAPNETPTAGLPAFNYNVRFPGQYYDAETGLHYNYYRDYDPSIGRYVESDPIGLRGGINTYAYVENSPLRYIDPFGLVRHVTGKTIDCGKGCTIRIDYTLDEKTGLKRRHLHWSCKGREGVCGEFGEGSHGGTWDDAPESIKQCARPNGFQGDKPTPDPVQEPDPILPITPVDPIPIPRFPIRIPLPSIPVFP